MTPVVSEPAPVVAVDGNGDLPIAESRRSGGQVVTGAT